MTKNDVYQDVTDRIVAALEAGTVPWRKPWRTNGGFDAWPVNLRNARRYRGVNVMLLALQGYDDPRWGTYNAIKAAGGQVRRGEKGTRIILWKPVAKNGENDNGEKIDQGYLLLREYVVFNALQADGLPELEGVVINEHEANERAEAVIGGYYLPPSILHNGSGASYSPLLDQVRMPNPENFDTPADYYQTLFHELIHSTGHQSRLNRLEPALFGTDPYAREELVAEIGASMVAGLVGLETAAGDNSAAYIANWLQRLRDDRKLIVNAAAQAQKASDRLVGDTFADEYADETDREEVTA